MGVNARKIIRREPDPAIEEAARAAGFSVLASHVAACRLDHVPADFAAWATPGLSSLDDPAGLPGIDVAAERLSRAIDEGEIIAVETDHDVDGVSGHSVVRRALIEALGVPAAQVGAHIGHRLREGYGLSDPVADRIIESGATLVLTVDNGSGDEARIARLREAGIDTIVTDHHAIPEAGPPASAYACVSPARADSDYPDAKIAGVMVAWLMMIRLARYRKAPVKPIIELVDYVALGTVADCVSLASTNNRAVVRAGLQRIRQAHRACWKYLREQGVIGNEVSSTDLAFGIGPRLNARGRMDSAMAGVWFLCADSRDDAQHYGEMLDAANQDRKSVEKTLTEQVKTEADRMVEAGHAGIVVYLPDGHAGVHGIVASRIVEHTGRPTVCLSPKEGEPGVATGSARNIAGVHIHEAFLAIDAAHPGLFHKFGGHEGAGGVTMDRDQVDTFRAAFEAQIRGQLGEEAADGLAPGIITDGLVSAAELTFDQIESLDQLEPFGQRFEAPLFEVDATIVEVVPVGAERTHLKLDLSLDNGEGVGAIWFNAVKDVQGIWPVSHGQRVRFYAEPGINVFRGEKRLQLMVRGIGEAAPAPGETGQRAPTQASAPAAAEPAAGVADESAAAAAAAEPDQPALF